jgi:hypothetical protein
MSCSAVVAAEACRLRMEAVLEWGRGAVRGGEALAGSTLQRARAAEVIKLMLTLTVTPTTRLLPALSYAYPSGPEVLSDGAKASRER